MLSEAGRLSPCSDVALAHYSLIDVLLSIRLEGLNDLLDTLLVL